MAFSSEEILASNSRPLAGSMPSSGKSIQASRLATVSSTPSRRASMPRPRRPSSWRAAARRARGVLARMMSITASAWVRSMRPFKKARRENSPGSAARAPWRSANSSTLAARRIPPWQVISAISSPVKLPGASNQVASAWSTTSPPSRMRPKTAWRGVEGFPLKIRARIFFESGPERRTIAMAPSPGGVAMAAMVSSKAAIRLGRVRLFSRGLPGRARGGFR